MTRKIANDLADALVVEDYGYVARSGEQRHAVSHRQRIGMIHLKPIPVDHRHRERLEWRSVLERLNRVAERFPVHCFLSPVKNLSENPHCSRRPACSSFVGQTLMKIPTEIIHQRGGNARHLVLIKGRGRDRYDVLRTVNFKRALALRSAMPARYWV
jgi:hypothetical protein